MSEINIPTSADIVHQIVPLLDNTSSSSKPKAVNMKKKSLFNKQQGKIMEQMARLENLTLERENRV